MSCKKITLVILSVLLVSSLGITSCKNNKKDKEIRVHLTDNVVSLDSGLAEDDISHEIIAGFTDGLMQLDHDGNAVCALAESYEVDEDDLVYTFKLRNAKWSNGDKVTADDFVYALRRLADPAFDSSCSYLLSDAARIKNARDIIAGKKAVSELGVSAKNDRTLVIELESSCQYLLSLLAYPAFYPVNEKFCEGCGDRYATSYDNVLSCGAFVIDSNYSPLGDSFSMSRNTEYWDNDNVSVDKISYRIIKDSDEALNEYRNGALDLVFLSDSQIDQYKDNEEFFSLDSGTLWYVSMNVLQNVFLQNLDMRKALAAAIDRELLCRNVVKGGLAAYYSVPEGIAFGPTGNDFTTDCPKWNYGVFAEAEAYLTKAKQELGMQTFVISLLVEDDPEVREVASFIESCWDKLNGVDCSLVVKTEDEVSASLMAHDFVVCLTKQDADYPDALSFLDMFRTASEFNFGQWSSDMYDSVIASVTMGDLSHSFNKRWMGLLKAEKMVMEDMVMIPVYQPYDGILLKKSVKGVDFHSVSAPRIFKHVTF